MLKKAFDKIQSPFMLYKKMEINRLTICRNVYMYRYIHTYTHICIFVCHPQHNILHDKDALEVLSVVRSKTMTLVFSTTI